MNNYQPSGAGALNFQVRKVKGLVKMFEGISCPWYFTNDVVQEGTPMRQITANPDQMTVCVAGSSHGPQCFGLALQQTYDESAFGQLKGYHFANDTRQRLNGLPIGLLTGKGWAGTLNYSGTVSYGQQAAIGPSGALIGVTGGTPTNDKLPIVFEGAGTNNNVNSGGVNGALGATLVRIRFDFPLNIVPLAS
jgi:hypothetical protein